MKQDNIIAENVLSQTFCKLLQLSFVSVRCSLLFTFSEASRYEFSSRSFIKSITDNVSQYTIQCFKGRIKIKLKTNRYYYLHQDNHYISYTTVYSVYRQYTQLDYYLFSYQHLQNRSKIFSIYCKINYVSSF